MRPFFIATILPGVAQPTQSDAEATAVIYNAGMTAGRHQAPGARLSGVDGGRLAGTLLVLHKR